MYIIYKKNFKKHRSSIFLNQDLFNNYSKISYKNNKFIKFFTFKSDLLNVILNEFNKSFLNFQKNKNFSRKFLMNVVKNDSITMQYNNDKFNDVLNSFKIINYFNYLKFINFFSVFFRYNYLFKFFINVFFFLMILYFLLSKGTIF